MIIQKANFLTPFFTLLIGYCFAQTPTGFYLQSVSATPCDISTGCFSSNPLLNGDFESGNTNFTTQYNPNNGTATCTANANCNGQYLCGQGYAIGNSATPCNPTWSPNIHDHTTGVGKMMIVDFPTNGTQDIWCQTVNLNAATDYCFGAYYINLMPLGNTTGQPSFKYTLNGTLIDVTSAIPATEQWEFRGFQFNSGAGGNVTLCIQNGNAGAIGFDAAIDDINLRQINVGTSPTAATDNIVVCNGSMSASIDVLVNDLAGSGSLDNNTLQIIQQPPFSQGSATVNQAAGTVTFNAAASFTGTTNFDYQICNTNGCCTTGSINVSQNPALSCSITANPGASVCANSLVTLTATPGFNSYQWSSNVTSATAGVATATPNPVSPATTTTYTVTATNSNGCTISKTIVITTTSVTPTAVSVAASTNPACSGASITFTATPFGGGATPSYQWVVNGSNAGINSSTFVTSVLSNNDVVGVVMTSSAVCANTAFGSVQMQITPSTTPTLNFSASTTTICSGDNVDFITIVTNAGGTPSYAWTLNNVIIPTATGSTYSTTSLNNGDQVSVTLTSSDACAQPPSITATPITITVNNATTPTLSITAPSTPICQGSIATFTAVATGVSGSPTYQWQVNGTNAGINSPTFSSNTLNNNDVISCTVTNTAACSSGSASAQTNAIIATPATPQITLTTPSTTICNGSFATFTCNITANGGTNPTYAWFINGAPQTGIAGNVFSTANLSTGDLVQVAMTSDLACATNNPATANVQMTILPNVTPSITVNSLTSPVCSGQTYFFNATTTNSGATPSYQWKVNGVNVGTDSPNFNINTLSNGDNVACYLTSSINCAVNPAIGNVIAAITPSVTPQVTILTNATAACAGQLFTFTAVGIFPGPSPTYVWSVNGINAGLGNTFSSNQLANNDNVSVTMTTSAACPTSPTATASQPIQVQTISPIATLLQSDTCKLYIGRAVVTPNGTATGVTYSYEWSNSEAQDTAHHLLGNKTYTVTVTDNLGCHDTAMIYIPLQQGVHIDRVETSSQFCGINGQLIEGSANPVFNNPHLPHTYAWYDITGSLLPVTDSLAGLNAGSYTVVVTDRNGCTATAKAIVPPPIFPNVTINASKHEIILGDSVTLTTQATANDILTYQWNPVPSYCLPCKNIEVGPLTSTIYTVTVTNLANCTATASTEIQVLNNYNVYIPNIFTPNNDGLNDHFTIQSGPNVAKITSLRIYDRWGEVVFGRNNITTNEANTSWDGTFKNQKVPMGVYIYHIEVEYVDGKHQSFHGDVTLME